MKPQRVLVTGAAGYIGSILVPSLLTEGYEVTALDTYARGDPDLAMCCADVKFSPVRGDVRDSDLVSRLVAKADIVIPLAAFVGAPLCKMDPWTATAVNRDAILAQTKMLSHDQRLIFPTTNSGYGIGEKDKECTE